MMCLMCSSNDFFIIRYRTDYLAWARTGWAARESATPTEARAPSKKKSKDLEDYSLNFRHRNTKVHQSVYTRQQSIPDTSHSCHQFPSACSYICQVTTRIQACAQIYRNLTRSEADSPKDTSKHRTQREHCSQSWGESLDPITLTLSSPHRGWFKRVLHIS